MIKNFYVIETLIESFGKTLDEDKSEWQEHEKFQNKKKCLAEFNKIVDDEGSFYDYRIRHVQIEIIKDEIIKSHNSRD